MKKLAAATIATAAMFAAVMPSQAATMTQNFDVKVNLTAACRVQGGTPVSPVVDFGSYTAFQATPNTATAAFNVECTRNLPAPTYSFDGGSGNGVVAGLGYSVLASAAGPTGGADAAGTTPASADVYAITLTGNMPALQAGQSGAATTVTRTLTITY
jgi:hypothetical protein